MSRYSDAAPSSHTASPIIVTPSPVDDHVVLPPHKALSLPVDDDVEDCCIPVEGCELGLLTSFYEDKVSLPTECCKVLSTISDDSFYKGGFGMSPIFLSKNLPKGLGLLSSDRGLFSDLRTKVHVEEYIRDQNLVFKAFASAMQKLSEHAVKFGRSGEIRHRCDAFNN
ncbi:hypothetical protein T459_03082 [Capsicum annuum]|uniref:peroxidase n=1 Tax=Capsicum annuum TaxID=4072 RepID=A0A2G3ALW0_CAPAN|nr:hypothetical protein T459_03082 [Capsicum annuum]